jgi:hypothetical protein
MLAAAAAGCWLFLAGPADELRVFLSPPRARPLKTASIFNAAWHAAASKPACMLHGMLVLQNRHACCYGTRSPLKNIRAMVVGKQTVLSPPGSVYLTHIVTGWSG